MYQTPSPHHQTASTWATGPRPAQTLARPGHRLHQTCGRSASQSRNGPARLQLVGVSDPDSGQLPPARPLPRWHPVWPWSPRLTHQHQPGSAHNHQTGQPIDGSNRPNAHLQRATRPPWHQPTPHQTSPTSSPTPGKQARPRSGGGEASQCRPGPLARVSSAEAGNADRADYGGGEHTPDGTSACLLSRLRLLVSLQKHERGFPYHGAKTQDGRPSASCHRLISPG